MTGGVIPVNHRLPDEISENGALGSGSRVGIVPLLDKLDLGVPRTTDFARPLLERLRDVRGTDRDPVRPSKHYESVADLREFGMDAILHQGCRHENGRHKLEILDMGKKSLHGAMGIFRECFEFPPAEAEVMRVDCAADVPGVPVWWFYEHAAVLGKRFVADFDKLTADTDGPVPIVLKMSSGGRGLETIYQGKKPRTWRIYNKVAEWEREYNRLTRPIKIERNQAERMSAAGFAPDGELPELRSFEEAYGVSRDTILTRVERVVAAKEPALWDRKEKRPGPLFNVRRLGENIKTWDPWEKLNIAAGGKFPTPADFAEERQAFMWYCTVSHLVSLARRDGYARMRKFVSANTSGNAKKVLARVEPYLSGEGIACSVDDVRASWHRSLERQFLNAA